MKDLTVTRPFCKEDYNELLRQAVAVLPWSHNLLLMSYNPSPEHIVFYANEVFRSSYNLGFIDAVEPQYGKLFTDTEKRETPQYIGQTDRSHIALIHWHDSDEDINKYYIKAEPVK